MTALTWNYVKSLNNINAIEDFEKQHNVVFPNDLKFIIKRFNNGRPSLKTFDVDTLKECEFKKLLSFNVEDTENIYDFVDIDSKIQGFTPFANDSAGNLIGLYEHKIYYWRHESDEMMFLADTMTLFLTTLYEPE